MSDAQEAELLRLAESKGLVISVKHSKSLGRHTVEISVDDPAKDGGSPQRFHTYEAAREFLAEE